MGLDFSASAEIGIRKALATPRMKDVKEEDNIVGVISVRDIIRPVNLDEEPY